MFNKVWALPIIKAEFCSTWSTVRVSAAKVLEDIKEAVDEMNQVLSGKLKASDADELLDDL